jgi:hypothetical protein
LTLLIGLCGGLSTAPAQSVCLPAPRLLTTMPMGGQAGTEVDVTITGQHIEGAKELHFSDPRITGKQKLDADGQPLANQYLVKIALDCPAGIYEASVMTRLGLSASRVFSVGELPEITQSKPSTTVTTSLELPINSICNAVMPSRAINHYAFQARNGSRVIVDCAAKGIDSKLNAVLIVADDQGHDMVVERRGGVIDFTPPEDGTYVIKVHELTFKGGADYFYRLAITEAGENDSIVRLPSTRSVNSFSWPPPGLTQHAAVSELEPNNQHADAQQISLPCDISGSFAPAADVDTFEFTAKKGDVWWVEVASERLGLPTDPSIIVQHVDQSDGEEKLSDVAELSDIPSPVKVSSNGYAYDGPPYNAGSSDILGKIEIKADGVHRLQLLDLFGGTRNDPGNIYRLIIRKAEPDFALVGWALHMELRNGDRNALSKPIALRGGSTMPLEIVVVRRDGFTGEIELAMENLPDGVTASGLKIPAGASRGMMLVTAAEGAPRGISRAKMIGRATIKGQAVTRLCQLASMAWPVSNAWSEIPSPRLLADISVSVGGSEPAPITIAAREEKVWEAVQGQKLTIPLVHMRRSEFSGATMSLKTAGAGFERARAFDLPLAADSSEAVLDLAALKTPPGDYLIAFYGGAVAKYRYNPGAVVIAEASHAKATKELQQLDSQAKELAENAKAASGDQKAKIDDEINTIANRRKTLAAAVAAAAKQLKTASNAAKPKDIVDIIVSEPIAIRVIPAETK